VPRGVVLHHADVAKDERAWIGPVPATTPLRTLADCIAAGVSPDLVEQAIEQAAARGVVPRAAATELRRAPKRGPMRRTCDTPAAFKRALEDRLRAASSSGVNFARRRQLLVFDRFLARMVVASARPSC
jgi:hypothetical protein